MLNTVIWCWGDILPFSCSDSNMKNISSGLPYSRLLKPSKNMSSLVFVLSRAHKNMIIGYRVCFYHFFKLKKHLRKKELFGFFFKLFSNSQNMKRLLSELVDFMLVKGLERTSFWWYFTPFLDHFDNLWKMNTLVNHWLEEFSYVLFYCFSDLGD